MRLHRHEITELANIGKSFDYHLTIIQENIKFFKTLPEVCKYDIYIYILNWSLSFCFRLRKHNELRKRIVDIKQFFLYLQNF